MTLIDLTKGASPGGPGDQPDPPARTARVWSWLAARWLAWQAAGDQRRARWRARWAGWWLALVVACGHGWRVGWRLVVRHLLSLPVLVLRLLVWSPRGFARLVARLAIWVHDKDSADRRHAAPDNGEYSRIQAARRANLHARGLVFGSVLAVVSGPLLAWYQPVVMSWLVGAAVCGWIIKIVPGRSLTEVAIGVAVMVGIGIKGPAMLALIPRPPVWSVWWVAGLLVLAAGWCGRQTGTSVVDGLAQHGPQVFRPTAPMVIAALYRAGIPNMTPAAYEKGKDGEIRLRAPGVSRSRHGHQVELELPPGVTVGDVTKQREELAGALRRPLGCVWPSGGGDHPGHLRLFMGDSPMATAPQSRWPLASGQRIDIFDPIPLVTDEEGRWLDVTLMGTHAAIGGASGFGKSVALRQLAEACALDPRVRLVVFDGKLSGDLECVRKIAHRFYEGAEPEEVQEQVDALREIEKEITKRSRRLRDLPPEERSPKVTSALASKYPQWFSPIVMLFDEVQEYTQYAEGSKDAVDKDTRAEFIRLITRVSRLGRSAGIAMVLVSQKPDAKVIPTAIMGNCAIRLCFKVIDYSHNDQVLGTGAHKNGFAATQFGQEDKGLAWLRAETTPRIVRTWSEMVELDVAFALTDKAYAMREAAGLLTGQAAGEVEQPQILDVNVLEDVRAVLDANRGHSMSLTQICKALALLRAQMYGGWDAAALGAALRSAGYEVRSVHIKATGRSEKGVSWDRLVEAMDGPADGDARA